MASDAAGGAPGLFLGLASAASWGAGDFCGGLAARRSHVYGVVAVSQALGLALLAGLALLLAEPLPTPAGLAWGAAAGLAGGLGLVALYQGLALGRMGVAAPLAAVVSAGLPVLYGAFLEGLPQATQITGFGLALGAVWLLSRGEGEGPARLRFSHLGLPLLAGLGFGLFLIVIDHASEQSVLWPLVAARVSSLALISALALWGGRGGRPGRPPAVGQPALASRRFLALVALVGLFDTGGNAFYALAAQAGRLDVAATLSSLYPATTVLLARLVLKERLAPGQWLGAVAALAAVVLIAA